MDDLVTWLCAQLDDDERVARASGGGVWAYGAIEDDSGPDHWLSFGDRMIDVGLSGYEPIKPSQAAHIARHDPARVLREVDAKRAALREMESGYPGAVFVCEDECECGPGLVGRTCRMVRHLAAVYSDRDGYREEWRP